MKFRRVITRSPRRRGRAGVRQAGNITRAQRIADRCHHDRGGGCPTRGAASFDHLVGYREQRRWHLDGKRFSSRDIYDHSELCRLYGRQISWFFAFEDTAGPTPENGDGALSPIGRRLSAAGNSALALVTRRTPIIMRGRRGDQVQIARSNRVCPCESATPATTPGPFARGG